MVELLEQPSLAIIIDCWANNGYNSAQTKNYENVLHNIAEQIKNNEFIKSVAIASYANEGDFCSFEDQFIKNSLDFFVNETKWDILRNLWKNAKFGYDKDFFTHNIIKEIKFRDNQCVFSVFNNLDILYYCNFINPSIRNIYFFGQSWNVCVKDRPVGWLDVSTLNYHNLFSKKINLLTSKKCVFHPSVKDIQMDDYWTNIDNNICLLDESADYFDKHDSLYL